MKLHSQNLQCLEINKRSKFFPHEKYWYPLFSNKMVPTFSACSAYFTAPPPVAQIVLINRAKPLSFTKPMKSTIRSVGKRMKCRVPMRLCDIVWRIIKRIKNLNCSEIHLLFSENFLSNCIKLHNVKLKPFEITN